jgi:glyoxylase-like metal-dependent hydrolase (beta-lactamase superfamily II)
VRVTGTAQREAWIAKTWPPVEEVRSDLWSVPVPIPDSPLRYTLTYLVASDNELVVVDPGWDTDAGWNALADGLKASGASPADVTGIVVTHIHPDHHGLSGRLRAESGAWVAMHPAERHTLALLRAQGADMAAGDRAWLRRCGVPDDVAAELTMQSGDGHPFARMVDPDRLLEHGDLVPMGGRQLRVVWTPGHTPGHLCLHDETENLLLTGDHVLPRISPNIGLQPHAAEPPLASYLRSLESMAAFDSAEALPAHEYRFIGLASRVRMLLAHHERRCDEVIEILRRRGPATTWQVTTELTWSRGWAAVTGFMRRAALAEAGAHLQHLVDSRRIVATTDGPDQLETFATQGSLGYHNIVSLNSGLWGFLFGHASMANQE